MIMKVIYSIALSGLFLCTGFTFSSHYGKISEQNLNILQDTSKNDSDVVYSIVETSPTFKGGMDKFYKYIVKNLNYPKTARKAGIEGRVFVMFVVDKDGSIIDTEVVKGVHPDLDAEALRVVQESPKWNPAIQRGKYVKTRMNIPIVFKLDKKKKSKKHKQK